MLVRFLFGDDIFISYSRRDGANYAAALANELSQPGHDFSCFLDQWGATAASELSKPVLRAIDRSSVLVLIGTGGAAASPMVRQEIARFAQKKKWLRPHRPILPINMNSAFDQVSWSELTGLHRMAESEEARADGLPSERVVRLIENSLTFTRRNQRVRWLSLGALLLLLVSAGTSAAALWERQRAVAEARKAFEQEQIARGNKAEADKQASMARDNEKRAQEKEFEAKESAQRAEDQAKLARDNAHRAEDQRRQTERQTQIAQGRLLATQANLARDQRPDLLPRSVLLGIEAIRKLPGAEADEALRQGLRLLPRQIGDFPHNDRVISVAFSQDGKRLATTGLVRALRIWDVDTRQPIESKVRFEQAYGPVYTATLDPDWKLFAASTRDLKVRLWRVGTGELALPPLQHQRPVNALVFSPDGRFLAAGEEKTVRVWDVSNGNQVANMTTEGPDLSGVINALAFSPDGKRIAAVRRETAEIWETSTGKRIKNLKHQGEVKALAFSPKGAYLAVSTAMGKIKVWNAETFDSVANLEQPGHTISLAFSPDERFIATASKENKSVRIWKMEDGNDVASLAHGGGVEALSYSAGGEFLATGSDDRTGRLWEMTGYREIARMVHDESVRSVAFGPNGKYFATAGAGNTARLWDASATAEGAPLNFKDFKTSVAFGSRGDFLFSVTDDGTVETWSAASGEISRLHYGKSAREIALSPNGQYLALVLKQEITDDRDNTIKIIETPGNREVALLRHDGFRDWNKISEAEQARGVSYRSYQPAIEKMKNGGSVAIEGLSPNGRYLVTSSVTKDHRLGRVWDVIGGREIRRIEYPYNRSLDVNFSPDSSLLATIIKPENVGSDEVSLQVWRLSDGQELSYLQKRGHAPVLFTPDGSKLISSKSDYQTRVGTVTVWQVTSGKEISSFRQQNHVRDLIVSPDGRHLLTRDVASTAHVWDLNSGQELSLLKNLGEGPAAFSADGRYLATSRRDHQARLWVITVWDFTLKQPIASIKQEGQVHYLAFSPNGKHFASASGEDRTARIWEVSGQSEVARIALNEPVQTVVFSPDGRYLVTGESNQRARVWMWRPNDLINAACARLTVDLTSEEWSRYLPNERPRPTC